METLLDIGSTFISIYIVGASPFEKWLQIISEPFIYRPGSLPLEKQIKAPTKQILT